MPASVSLNQHDQPLVSVLITTYNVAAYLPEALSGVTAQAYRPLEVVACDDASNDDSVDVLKSFCDSHTDAVQFTVLENPINIGPYRSLKRALRAANGKYVAILDGDDVWLPDKLVRQVQWLEADPDRVLCAHDVECFVSGTDEVLWTVRSLGRLRSGRGAAHAVRNGPIYPTSAIMLRRDAVPPDFNRLNLDEFTDWCLWAECLAAGGAYGYVPGIYSRYRRNPDGYVARTGRSLEASAAILIDGLTWLGWFEAHYPQYHAECRFRRGTLMANFGKLLFESGKQEQARGYLRAAIPNQRTAGWQSFGLLTLTRLSPRLTRYLYRAANRGRLAARGSVRSLRHRLQR